MFDYRKVCNEQIIFFLGGGENPTAQDGDKHGAPQWHTGFTWKVGEKLFWGSQFDPRLCYGANFWIRVNKLSNLPHGNHGLRPRVVELRVTSKW